MLNLDFGGDINLNTEDDFGGLPAQVTPSLEVFARVGEGASGDLVEYMGLHNPGNTAVSPSTELLDLGGFCVGGNCDWRVTINLPWFQLQGLLQYPGLWDTNLSPRHF